MPCRREEDPRSGALFGFITKDRTRLKLLAEYAQRGLTKPSWVSGYVTKLVGSLPKALKGAVPSVADLERGLDRE